MRGGHCMNAQRVAAALKHEITCPVTETRAASPLDIAHSAKRIGTDGCGVHNSGSSLCRMKQKKKKWGTLGRKRREDQPHFRSATACQNHSQVCKQVDLPDEKQKKKKSVQKVHESQVTQKGSLRDILTDIRRNVLIHNDAPVPNPSPLLQLPLSKQPPSKPDARPSVRTPMHTQILLHTHRHTDVRPRLRHRADAD